MKLDELCDFKILSTQYKPQGAIRENHPRHPCYTICKGKDVDCKNYLIIGNIDSEYKPEAIIHKVRYHIIRR